MGRKLYCWNCVRHFRNVNGSHWGSKHIEVVPSCSACYDRSMVADLETTSEQEGKRHREALSSLQNERIADLHKHEDTVKKIKLAHTLALNGEKDDYDMMKSKVTFLQVPRDCVPGDVLLDVGGSEILAHKAILAAKSHVFKEKFQNCVTAVNSGGPMPMHMAILDETSHLVMEAVINFCYSGEISFAETVTPQEVLKVAHKYGIEHLKNVCGSELCETISIENLPETLKLSYTYAAVKLQKEVIKFFKQHCDDLDDTVFEMFDNTTTSKKSLE